MGRRQGSVVTPPKAAAALPEIDGDTALAVELGMPSMPAASSHPDSESIAPATSGDNDDDRGSAASAGSGNGAESRIIEPINPSAEEIMGGLAVVEADMEGVDTEELEYLMNRCKRSKQAS